MKETVQHVAPKCNVRMHFCAFSRTKMPTGYIHIHKKRTNFLFVHEKLGSSKII